MEAVYDDTAALLRQFHFLASLRDQYPAVAFPFPSDLPINWLLREVQLPHRPVTQATADLHVVNRLQLRVLDHQKFIEPMHLPESAKGRTIVAVREAEGHVSKFSLDIAGGRAGVKASDAGADFECADRIWAAIVCGQLPASQAVALGLASASASSAAGLLDLFSRGPAPFCTDAF
jgi:predicted acetyltransferase